MINKSLKLHRPAMELAILEAKSAFNNGDYPIGACLYNTKTKKVYSIGNNVLCSNNAINHAEISLISKVCRIEGTRYLTGYTLYSTHSPCPMCFGACVWSNIKEIIYGVDQATISKYTDLNNRLKWRSAGIEVESLYKSVKKTYPNISIIGGFMKEECLKLFDL